jgi:pseudooxynicotine oxidase
MSDSKTTDRQAAGVTRRDFIGTAGVAAIAAAGLAPGPAAPATGSPAGASGEWDVIIIGGGFCGVTAARECRQAGYRVLLLEARNRLGGRTFTADFNGLPVDMGGTWVHWSQPHVWSEIRRSGLALQESSGAAADKLIVHTSGNDIVTLSNAGIAAKLERSTAEFMGDSREILPLPHDPFGSDAYLKLDGISAAERLASLQGVKGLYRDLLDGNFAGCGHNYTDQFAWIEMVRWYALPGHNLTDMDDATSRFHFRDGTVALLDALLAQGGPEVRLGAPVRTVIQQATHITVVTDSGEELRARAVVSTVPLNVLKDIDWQPALPQSKLLASRETHAGRGTKLHALIEGDHGAFSGVAPSHFALNALMTESVGAGHTHLIGFGPDPALLDVNDAQAVEKAVRLFIPDAKVTRTLGYQWTLDPYSRGTWCTLRPGMWSKYLRDLQQSRERLIFASADWANGWRGFIDGAIEQGLEAGRRVSALLHIRHRGFAGGNKCLQGFVARCIDRRVAVRIEQCLPFAVSPPHDVVGALLRPLLEGIVVGQLKVEERSLEVSQRVRRAEEMAARADLGRHPSRIHCRRVPCRGRPRGTRHTCPHR